MFYLIFGTFWTAITAVITIVFYNAEGVTVNGVWTPADEFAEMLAPKLFLGIFWAVGLIFLFVGIRKIVRNMSDKYRAEDRGIKIIELEDSFQMCTKAEYYEGLIKVATAPKRHVLTDAVLETLSIIAWADKFPYICPRITTNN